MMTLWRGGGAGSKFKSIIHNEVDMGIKALDIIPWPNRGNVDVSEVFVMMTCTLGSNYRKMLRRKFN